MKYYVLLPQVDLVGSGLDNYQWRTLLRAMSAHRAFNWAYGGEVTPSKIADFLILNRQCPRSLMTSIQEITHHLDRLAHAYGQDTDAQSMARGMLAALSELRVEDIHDEGLHEFLARQIDGVLTLGALVHGIYLSGVAR